MYLHALIRAVAVFSIDSFFGYFKYFVQVYITIYTELARKKAYVHLTTCKYAEVAEYQVQRCGALIYCNVFMFACSWCQVWNGRRLNCYMIP